MDRGRDDLPRWYAALDGALDASLSGQERARVLEDVVVDLRNRAYCDDHEDHHPGETTLARLDKWLVVLVLVLPLLGCVGTGIVHWAFAATAGWVRLSIVVAVIGGIGLLIWCVGRSPVGPARLARRCGGCKYDLSGHTDAVAKSGLGGYAIGPRQCPECGRRWPVVPRR